MSPYPVRRTRAQPFRFTQQECRRLAGLGFFDGCRVELLDGQAWEVPSLPERHYAAIA